MTDIIKTKGVKRGEEFIDELQTLLEKYNTSIVIDTTETGIEDICFYSPYKKVEGKILDSGFDIDVPFKFWGAEITSEVLKGMKVK